MRKIHDLGNHEQSLHKVKNDLLFGITSLLGLNISLLPMASAHRRSFWLWFRWSSCKSKFKSMHKVWDIIKQRREKKVCSYELYLNITINNNSITHNKKEGNKKSFKDSQQQIIPSWVNCSLQQLWEMHSLQREKETQTSKTTETKLFLSPAAYRTPFLFRNSTLSSRVYT